MTGRDWERLILSKIDPFQIRVSVKYHLIAEAEQKGQDMASGSPELAKLEDEVDRICERYFGIKPVPGAICYVRR